MHLLLAAALVFAQHDMFCDDVHKLAEGAKEAVPFATLHAEGFAPHFEVHCQPNGRSYLCSRNLLPPALNHQSLAARIAGCLTDAKISVEKPGAWSSPTTVVVGEGLRFELEETGSDIAHVGRILSMTIRAAPRAGE